MKAVKELLDFTPRDENDYFTLFHFRIGRKLGYAILLTVIFFCLLILLLMNPASQLKNIRSYPVFGYDSFFLKYYKGKAGIRSEDGHIAYVGKVSKGMANGKGTLYDAEENILYEGNFSDNLYQGKGILYRPGFIKEYEGSFKAGMKQGKGKLYDENAALIFTGNFSKDKIVFEEMAGKPTSDISKKYQGRQIIYNKEDEMSVVMSDIQAMYYAASGGDSLKGEWLTKGIYVLDGVYTAGNKTLETESELKAYFGKPQYQGTTAVQFGDAVALEQAAQFLSVGTPRIDTVEGLTDVYEVTGFDAGYEVYLSVYEKAGFRYTFFSENKEKKDTFLFYLIEPEEE